MDSGGDFWATKTPTDPQPSLMVFESPKWESIAWLVDSLLFAALEKGPLRSEILRVLARALPKEADECEREMGVVWRCGRTVVISVLLLKSKGSAVIRVYVKFRQTVVFQALLFVLCTVATGVVFTLSCF